MARAPLPRATRGFTLVELLVALSVLAVLLSLAVPSFQSSLMSNRLTSYANSWFAAAQLAKSEAIKRGNSGQVVLCRSTDGATCASSGTWQQGWVVCADANANGTCDAGETVIATQSALSPDYHFTSTRYAQVFQASGSVANSGDVLTLCRATPSAGNQERQIILLSSGKAYVKTTTTGICT